MHIKKIYFIYNFIKLAKQTLLYNKIFIIIN